MAQKEIIRADYDSIKASLDAGQSVNEVSKAFNLGNRRVALIKRSKSYTSYIGLRTAERRKRAENTPAKATDGGHELPQGEQPLDATEFVDTAPNGDTVPADKVKINGDGTKEDLRTDEELAEANLQKREAEMRRRLDEKAKARRRAHIGATIFAYSVMALAVVGVIALVWGAIYLITR